MTAPHRARALELLQCFHVWGIPYDEARQIIAAMANVHRDTGAEAWARQVRQFVNPNGTAADADIRFDLGKETKQ